MAMAVVLVIELREFPPDSLALGNKGLLACGKRLDKDHENLIAPKP
jgi:hypothetical protein